MGKKKAAASFTDDDDALLAELGVETDVKQAQSYTPKQERIIAGFEDIQRFYREHKRRPQHGDERDIFERLYAVRLARIVADAECLELLRPLDEDGLLDARVSEEGEEYSIESDDQLLEALGVVSLNDDIMTIKHVRAASERNTPEEVAQRKPCEDFDSFRENFEKMQEQIESGARPVVPLRRGETVQVNAGNWFILQGQKAYIASTEKWYTAQYGRRNRRLRVIFGNGTEAHLLQRSFETALQKDPNGRRIMGSPDQTFESEPTLFSTEIEADDIESGSIYVARSLCNDSFFNENRELVHKIGVTGGDPKSRIAGARTDPTFLLADAELVAVFQLSNVNRKKLESTLHRFFSSVRLDVSLADRFGASVRPQEWFLVPLSVIHLAVERILDGTITKCMYDPASAQIVELHQ